MIISQTPFRISFFGGGTDYPAYFKEHGGQTLATSIDKYCYISCRRLRPFFNHKHRIVYSKMELVNDYEDLVHPSFRETLKHIGINDGLELHHDGDLPARTGLGSSSAFTVGLLHALHAFNGKIVEKMALAEEAIHIEQNLIGENVGSQDQVATAVGGLNHISFSGSNPRGFEVNPVFMPVERTGELEKHLLLFFTGFQRNATDIAAEQIKRTPDIRAELSEMGAMVTDAMRILSSGGDITEFGKLLHESWMLKRSLTSKITNGDLDEMYRTAQNSGALGGKILGAGGGGFFLFFAKPEYHESIKSALGLMHVPFRFEYNGTRILVYARSQTG